MNTSQATIMHDENKRLFLVYSPKDGIYEMVERSELDGQWRFSEYKTPHEIDADTPYYIEVKNENEGVETRKFLLYRAIKAYERLSFLHGLNKGDKQ